MPTAATKNYTLPQTAALFAQGISDIQFSPSRYHQGDLRWQAGEKLYFQGANYGAKAGWLYAAMVAVGTGRATCACCGQKIAKNDDCLLLEWKDSESYGYHLHKMYIHRAGCKGE